MTYFKKLAMLSAAAVVGVSLAGAASASTISFQNGEDGGGTEQFTLNCTSSCTGWLFGAGTSSSTIGGLILFKDQTYATGQGEAWEKDLLAGIAGATLAYSKNETPSTGFTSDAAYHLFKIGNEPNIGVVVNTSGGSQSYTFAAKAGEGAGLSHLSDYGTVSVVPLPAAGWLMLIGLGGLGVASRRRRKAHDS